MRKHLSRLPGCVDGAFITLSALLLILMFPAPGVHYLAWFALVPLFLVIKQSNRRRAFLSSLLAGFIFFTAHLWWLLGIESGNFPSFSLAMLGHALYLGLFGLASHYFNRKHPGWNVLTFPSAWVALEYLRAHMGFLSTPWGILGYSQYSVPIITSVAVFAGVYGVSFIIIAVNALLAEIVQHRVVPSFQSISSRHKMLGFSRASLGIFGVTIILVFSSNLYGLSISHRGEERDGITAGLVRAGVYEFEKNDPKERETVFEKYYGLTLRAAHDSPDIIIWPSSAVPGKIPVEGMLVRTLANLARETGNFLLVGSGGFDKLNPEQRNSRRIANSAFLFSPDGEIIGRYDKVWLLPFDEYLPLRGIMRWPSWIVDPGMMDSYPGRELTVFTMRRLKFGVQICWENLFPDQFRKVAQQGVDFMIGMTNEAFTGAPTAHYNMLAMYVFRAIENNVPLVRVSTTGISGIIDSSGRIISRIGNENFGGAASEGYIVGNIPIKTERTFYTRFGDWFVYVLSVVLGIFILMKGSNQYEEKELLSR